VIDPERLRELEERLGLDDQARRQLHKELHYLRYRMRKGATLDRALQDWRTEADRRERKRQKRDTRKARRRPPRAVREQQPPPFPVPGHDQGD
jgi:hypothetical protein